MSFFQHNFDTQKSDIGFTIIELKRKYGGCYVNSLNPFTEDTCPTVTVKFEASKTKHAKYIYQADVDVAFDNIGTLFINGVNYVNNNVTDLKTYRYLNKANVNSSFNLIAHNEDDATPDTMVLKIDIFLYYK